MNNVNFRESATNAIRYWERARILYNVVLFAITSAVFVANLPSSQDALSFAFARQFFVYAVIANICYFAAYPVDLLVQASDFRGVWLRHRWILFVVGTLFASVLAYAASQYLFFAFSFGQD